MSYSVKRFSRLSEVEFSEPREKVPSSILEKAKKEGVVQKDGKGQWRIISIQKGEYWNAIYESKEKAEAALRAYHSHSR